MTEEVISKSNLLDAQYQLTRKNFCLDVNLQSQNFKVLALFGPSGSGKTTLLRCLAGLNSAQGQCVFNQNDWQKLKAWQRPCAYVFQQGNLFTHLNVEQNLQFSIKRASKPFNETFFGQVIDILKIKHLLKQNIETLSGGETQRVAIARALLRQPELLLLDEPLASLDEQHKQQILKYLCELKNKLNIAMIYVSHNIDEIAQIADVVCHLEQGKIKAQAKPSELFTDLDFNIQLGKEAGVLWEGKITEIDSAWQIAHFKSQQNMLRIPNQNFSLGEHFRVRILAKDVSLTLSESFDSSILNRFPVTITDISESPTNASALIKVQSMHNFLFAQITHKSLHHLKLKTGMQVWAQVKSLSLLH